MIPGLLAAIAVFSYLLGGLNGAIIASKYAFHRDVRDYGSGNAGLTNFYRTFGAPGLAIVIGTDVLKTVIAVVAGGLIMGTQGAASTGQVFAGFCVMLGHIYPVFYGFRGGKGVLCAETMLLIVSFPTGLVSLLIFVGIVWAHALCVARQHLRRAHRAHRRARRLRQAAGIAEPVLRDPARGQASQQHRPPYPAQRVQTVF